MSLNLVDWLGDNAWSWWLTVSLIGICVTVLTHSRWASTLAWCAAIAAAGAGVGMVGDRAVQIIVPSAVFVVAVAVLVPVRRPWRHGGISAIRAPRAENRPAPRRAA